MNTIIISGHVFGFETKSNGLHYGFLSLGEEAIRISVAGELPIAQLSVVSGTLIRVDTSDGFYHAIKAFKVTPIEKDPELNFVALSGRLAADPESRQTSSNKVIADATLYVRRTSETSDKIMISAWEKTAEVFTKYCHKGNQISLTGRLQGSSFTKGEKTISRFSVTINQLDLPSKPKNEEPFQSSISEPYYMQF